MSSKSIATLIAASLVLALAAAQSTAGGRGLASDGACTTVSLFRDSHPPTAQSFARLSFTQILRNAQNQYRLGELYKQRFDRDVDSDASTRALYTTETYAKLMGLRETNEGIRDQALANIRSEIEDRIAANPTAEEPKVIQAVLTEKLRALRDAAAADSDPATAELGVTQIEDDVIEKLRIVNDCAAPHRAYAYSISAEPNSTAALSARSDRRHLLVAKAVREENLGTPQSAAEGGIREENYVGDWKAKQAELRNLFSPGRDPSDLRYAPSAGKGGNLFGYEFSKGTWALTFDDGPGKTTWNVLDNLRRHGMKATFFVLSQLITDGMYPKSALREQSDGHATGCHSYTHANITHLSETGVHHEIDDALAVFRSRFGAPAKFFRLPYGAGVSNPTIRQHLADLGVIHVYWNVDTLDWQDKDPDSIVSRAKKQMNANGRGIILFHDVHPQSVIASERIMTYLQDPANGLRTVTLPEAVDELNGLVPENRKIPVEAPRFFPFAPHVPGTPR